MSDLPYESVEISKSEPGEIVDKPTNGEAVGVELSDESGNYYGYLIEWKGTSGAWISGDNNVSLSGEM